jgi:TPR repeat protein
LGSELSARGKPTEAELWYRRSAEAGWVPAAYDLGALLFAKGELREARLWLHRVTGRGFLAGPNALAKVLWELGEDREAQEWSAVGVSVERALTQAAEKGDMDAAWTLALVLFTRGAEAEANRWRQRVERMPGTPTVLWMDDLENRHY